MTRRNILGLSIFALTLTSYGCEADKDTRIADLAERHAQHQADQNRRIAELHQHVAEERAEVGRQRDALEAERRELAQQRRMDPIIAATIANAALLLGCLLPLVLCWQLLVHRDDPADDAAVAEAFLEDLVAKRPLLLPPRRDVPTLGYQDDPLASNKDDESDAE